MDQFRRVLATIQKHLGALTPTQKLLIGSLAVIMLMTLFLVSQYAGKPTLLPVWPGGSAEDQARVLNVLHKTGLEASTDSKGQVVVPAAQQLDATAALLEAGQQPTNSPLVFDNLLKSQNWMNSKEENRQIYAQMRNNTLAAILSRFHGIKSAQVMIDAPEQVGFGASAKPARASIFLFPQSGTAISQEMVDAAAKAVAGAVAGLELERVNVIDGSTNVSRKVRTEGDLASSSNREMARAIEHEFEQKLLNSVLGYIPGVQVAVTATVDTTRVRSNITKNLPTGEGTVVVPRKESTTTSTESQGGSGAEPGVRSNAMASINQGGGAGVKSDQKTEETEYNSAFGVEHKEVDDPRGMATSLAATVAVPRSFITGLLKEEGAAAASTGGSGGAAPAGPTEKEVQDRFDLEKKRITEAVQPHLKTRTDGGDKPGEVVVVMMSGPGAPQVVPGGGGGSMGGGMAGTFGTMWAMGSGAFDKIVLGALAAAAMGMMLMMVRRAGKRVEMPTPEELVGLPLKLEAKSDLVGEADESETAMAGIEVGEEEIKATKMRESVAEFIKQSPDAASKLLNRWIAVEH